MSESRAQIILASENLVDDMRFLETLHFRLDRIYPDDDPSVAEMSGHQIHIRLDRAAASVPVNIEILTDDPDLLTRNSNPRIAPNGCRFTFRPQAYKMPQPHTKHVFEVRQLRDQEPWVIGRADMLYHDLLPGRLGGAMMASHIRIPVGGPVPDMVHFHSIGFQLIYCYRGWVKLVYEDQGPPFVLAAGDCVTQPPEIRHRVLEASDELEVIEIGVPAEHMTTIDHDMELPTLAYRPDRVFQGQTFCRHQLRHAIWQPWRLDGFEHRDTGVARASDGLAAVHVARPQSPTPADISTSHDFDIHFTFVLQGSLVLGAAAHDDRTLKEGDTFVIPPGLTYQLSRLSSDLELLEITLPG